VAGRGASPAPLPPIRLILIWDNLAGHKTPTLVHWLRQQGTVPLYTPPSGSWSNMAESVQHILKERAPTPSVWAGKRKDRRERARTRWRARRLRGSAALLPNAIPIAA
jgi:hypothetical protein